MARSGTRPPLIPDDESIVCVQHLGPHRALRGPKPLDCVLAEQVSRRVAGPDFPERRARQRLAQPSIALAWPPCRASLTAFAIGHLGAALPSRLRDRLRLRAPNGRIPHKWTKACSLELCPSSEPLYRRDPIIAIDAIDRRCARQ